jgi:hypothetical protein
MKRTYKQENPKKLSRQARARINKKLKKNASPSMPTLLTAEIQEVRNIVSSISTPSVPTLSTAETQEVHNIIFDTNRVFITIVLS